MASGEIDLPLSDGNQSQLYFETENKCDFSIFILSNHYINNTLFIPKKKRKLPTSGKSE